MARIRSLPKDALPRAALIAVAAAVAAAVLVLAAAHVDDRFGVDHVSGSWLGLAAAAREGVLYPPLAEDGFYGGTRWLPLPFLLYAGAAAVTGDLLTGAKLVTYAAAAAVLLLVALACRRRGAPWPAAAALTAAVAATWAGVTVFLGVRGDAVSLALGLGALSVVERRTSGRAVVAGVLCALALLAKLSALWAPAALVACLALSGSRRLAALAAVAFAGVSALLLGATELASDGRLHANLVELAFAGSEEERGAFAGVRSFYDLALRDQRSAWPLLVAAAAVSAVALVRRRAGGPYELALVTALAIALVVLRDTGARENHLLDVTALAAVAAAGAWRPGVVPAKLAAVARLTVSAAVVLAIALAARHTLVPPLRDVLDGSEPRLEQQPLRGVVSDGDCVVSQDPTLPLLLGLRPVVLDPFMLRRMDDGRHARELAERIRVREFDRVVLFVRPDVDAFHFRRYDFGAEVAEAIEASYRLTATVQTSPPSYVYAPRGGPRQPCAAEPVEGWSA